MVHSCHRMVAVEEMAPRCSEGDKETGLGIEVLPLLSCDCEYYVSSS